MPVPEQHLEDIASESVEDEDEIVPHVELHELREQFKVFRDPSFEEFIRITGGYDPEMPLFVQLYILKEYLQFYQLTQNNIFLPMMAVNLLCNTGYFLFRNRYMLNKNIKLFRFARVCFFWFATQAFYESTVINTTKAHEYKCNLNDLLDQDEPFLKNNEAFQRMIRRTYTHFNHLVNPNFDLSEVMEGVDPN